MKKYLLVFDVDSTLIREEVIELLAEEAGARERVADITHRAMSGEIDFEQSLRQRVALLAGLPESVISRVQKRINLSTGAKELIKTVHDAGGMVGAVSGGFTQLLVPLARELGLDFHRANHLEIVNGVITGNLLGEIIDRAAKATALLEWKNTSKLSHTVAIGDGANDVAMLKASGFAVAFRPKDVLRPHADLIIEGNSLAPVIAELELRSS
jgi:phosphoserine phosphatase